MYIADLPVNNLANMPNPAAQALVDEFVDVANELHYAIKDKDSVQQISVINKIQDLLNKHSHFAGDQTQLFHKDQELAGESTNEVEAKSDALEALRDAIEHVQQLINKIKEDMTNNDPGPESSSPQE